MNDVTSNKKIIYTVTGIRRADGLTDSIILDIISLEGRKGYYLSLEELYEGDPKIRNRNGMFRVSNYVGVIEFMFDELIEGRLFDIPLTPNWIVTANEEGKISISKPVDDEMFIWISSEE